MRAVLFLLSALTLVYVVSAQRKECPMPRCPPNCGFRSGYNGCRQCDCSIPRGPIKETPCTRVCPADCGQRTRLDGCLECMCGELFFKPPTGYRGRG